MRRLVRRKSVRRRRNPDPDWTQDAEPGGMTLDQMETILCAVEPSGATGEDQEEEEEEEEEEVEVEVEEGEDEGPRITLLYPFHVSGFKGKPTQLTQELARESMVRLLIAYRKGRRIKGALGTNSASENKGRATDLFNFAADQQVDEGELARFLEWMEYTGRILSDEDMDFDAISEGYEAWPRKGPQSTGEEETEEVPPTGKAKRSGTRRARAETSKTKPPDTGTPAGDEGTGTVDLEGKFGAAQGEGTADRRLTEQLITSINFTKGKTETFKTQSAKTQARFAYHQQFLASSRHKPLPTVQQLWQAVIDSTKGDEIQGQNEEAWLQVFGKIPQSPPPMAVQADGTKIGTPWKYFAPGYGGNDLSKAIGTILLVIRLGPSQNTQMLVPSSTPVVSRGEFRRKVGDTAEEGQLYWAPVAEFISRSDLRPWLTADPPITSSEELNKALGDDFKRSGAANVAKELEREIYPALRANPSKIDSFRQMVDYVRRVWKLGVGGGSGSARASQRRAIMPIMVFKEIPGGSFEYVYTFQPRMLEALRVQMDTILKEDDPDQQATANPRRRIGQRTGFEGGRAKRKKRIVRRVKRR